MFGQSAVRGTVAHLVELERRIEDQAAALSGVERTGPALTRIAEGLRTSAAERRERLEAARERVDAIAPFLPDLQAGAALRSLYTSLNEALLGYAALHAVAHRAFDSQGPGNTADLAESHLRAHARAIQDLDLLISDAVILESSEMGIECRCACPACDLGLCLCSPHGANTLRQAWRETLPPAEEGGLRVRPPRQGSEAQRADLRGGDRLTAIDGAPIPNDLDAASVQAAIRAHPSGEEIRLDVRGAHGESRVVSVHRP